MAKNILDDADIIKHSQTQKNKKSWIAIGQKKTVYHNKEIEEIINLKMIIKEIQ